MLVAIDIGNSNVVVGIWDGNWKYVWRLETVIKENPMLFYEMKFRNLLLENGIEAQGCTGAIISSVVPELTDTFNQLVKLVFSREAIVVGPKIYPTIQLEIVRPYEIGADLVANAVAASTMTDNGMIIIDFGTALTFTTLSPDEKILGVSITPGLKTAISALYQKTAQLPEVPLEYPDSAIGKNTVQAIQSGILVGYVGLVQHMIASIKKEVGLNYKTVATGGLSDILKPLHNAFDFIDPHLTLNGLRIIRQRVLDSRLGNFKSS